jgi:hypothetical protein
MVAGEPELTEDDAYPAQPDNEYGWEKLYSERALLASARRHGFAARIARFQNCYGPEGTWDGGREKAPAALCRKVAEARDGGRIEVWGDGTAVRSYTYVDDMVDGIRRLMDSDLEGPANIGSPEYVSVKELVDTVMAIARKRVDVEYVSGPVGVQVAQLQQRADLLDRLAAALLAARRHRADLPVDRAPGRGGASEELGGAAVARVGEQLADLVEDRRVVDRRPACDTARRRRSGAACRAAPCPSASSAGAAPRARAGTPRPGRSHRARAHELAARARPRRAARPRSAPRSRAAPGP